MANGNRTFTHPLAVQFALPRNYREDKGFEDVLAGLRETGITGVELNIADPFSLDWADLFELLRKHDLSLFRFASGLTAKTLSLSLSAADEDVRQRSVLTCRRMVQALRGTGIGIIIGFLKGPTASDREAARGRFARSLAELAPDAADMKIPLVVEATNRYESAVANSLDDAVSLLPPSPAIKGRWVQILPDTFHMNIEESDMAAPLRRHAALYSSVHLSDNNRFFPGYGAIPFSTVIDTLNGIGWKGFFAIEGNIKEGLVADAREAVGVLAPLLS